MKKKILLVLVTMMTVFSLTGCTKILKDENKKAVQNKETGQSLVSNILCQPESEITKKTYDEHNFNYSKLPKCENFSVTSGSYAGLWDSLFVKPLAWIIIKVGSLVKSYGFALIIITILIRLILYPFTQKTAMQSELLKKAKPELDKLENKYRGRQDQESMMQKSQEMMVIYKKYNISPLSGCLFSFIQIPLFFAFYEAINRLPAIFEENLFGVFQLGTTPMVAITKGNWYYLIFSIIIIATTYFSFKLNSGAAMGQEQEKQMQMMYKIMVVFIAIASFSLTTGVAFYWITNSTCTIIQNLIVKRRKA